MRIWTWIKGLFKKTTTKVDYVMDALGDDVQEVLLDIVDILESDDRRFVIEMTVPEDIKIRTLKATLESTIVEKLAKTHPSIVDIKVKTYYNKK